MCCLVFSLGRSYKIATTITCKLPASVSEPDTKAAKKGQLIWSLKPSDFGTTAYGNRRRDAIDRHFSKILYDADLECLFNLWLPPSEVLRQYLWAHKPSDIERAKRLLALIPKEKLLLILRYLVDDYWKHYLGWPDIFVYRQDEYFFAEIKSSGDRLSDEQKRWIRDNHASLKLPFKLVKIRKFTDRQG